VIPGITNDNEVIIHAGVETGDEVMLLPPENPESYRLVMLDPEIIEKYKKEEQLAQKEEKPAEEDEGDWRKKWENATPEQREAMKKKFQQGGERKRN
jgi:hypothetical protein